MKPIITHDGCHNYVLKLGPLEYNISSEINKVIIERLEIDRQKLFEELEDYKQKIKDFDKIKDICSKYFQSCSVG